MEKLDTLTSEDVVANNIEKLKEIFPTAFSEGKLVVEELQALVGEYIQKEKEYYKMTWAGKTEAQKEANKVSTGTLRPCKEESKDWDTTGNIFIEGDNLEVLKLLQKTYSNKIKMIYIDPPYNTGKDFVYKDNYKDNLSNYLEITGQTDEEGKRLTSNTDSDGRYHSNWLNMMYPRLKLARNLLTDDGVIFISIDDHEQVNLSKLCNEIFGEENFVSDITVVNNLKGRNDKKYIATANERLIMYVKTDDFQEYGLSLPDDKVNTYSLLDDKGAYRLIELRKRGGADTRLERPNMYYPFYVNPLNGEVALNKDNDYFVEALPRKSNGVDGRWRWGKDTALTRVKSLIGKLVQGTEKYNIYEKDYLEQNGELRRIKPKSVMSGASYSTDVATKSYRQIMCDIDFTNPKPVELLKDLIEYSTFPDNRNIILDFFAGSGTTSHAVMSLNAEKGGNRKCISVQLPEPADEKSEAYKAGYKTIAEITKERIRRAGELVKEENKDKEGIDKLDVGFRVFKLDSSNIQAWDTSLDKLQDQLDMFDANDGDHIKADRKEEDVLFEILLKYGLELTMPIQERVIANCKVYNIGFGSMYICLANSITPEVAKGIGEWHKDFDHTQPAVIFKDAGFAGDPDKTNTVQTLRQFGIENVKSI